MRNLKSYRTNIWVLKNFHILYRVIRGFIRALIFNKKTLKTIEIFPTLDCNLKCTMCSMEKYKKSKRPELTLEDYARISREGAKLGAIAVNVLGGEPFLKKDLKEIVRTFKADKYFVLIVSNSLLVTLEKLRELKKAGLDAICFSLDDLDPEVNDEVRGLKGHHSQVFEAVELAQEVGLIVSLAPVFFPGKVTKGLEVVKYCQEHGLGASGTQVGAVGAWEEGQLLSPDEHDSVREMLKNYPRFTLDWALSYYLKACCPAGKEKIAITTFGDVVGCSINPIAFGNVRAETLEKIWNRMGRFSQYRKDSPICLSAEDREFVKKYLRPLKGYKEYPIYYYDHPAISHESERDLFNN